MLVAADPGHDVDAAAAADDLAHRENQRPSKHRRVRLGGIAPIAFAADVRRPKSGVEDRGDVVRATGLQQQHLSRRVLGKPARNNGSGAPGPYDDVIVFPSQIPTVVVLRRRDCRALLSHRRGRGQREPGRDGQRHEAAPIEMPSNQCRLELVDALASLEIVGQRRPHVMRLPCNVLALFRVRPGTLGRRTTSHTNRIILTIDLIFGIISGQLRSAGGTARDDDARASLAQGRARLPTRVSKTHLRPMTSCRPCVAERPYHGPLRGRSTRPPRPCDGRPSSTCARARVLRQGPRQPWRSLSGVESKRDRSTP